MIKKQCKTCEIFKSEYHFKKDTFNCRCCMNKIEKEKAEKKRIANRDRKRKQRENEPAGIYLIKNTSNDKEYIGKSSHINTRRVNHFSRLRKNAHKNKELQEDYNSYGEDCFEFSIIEKLENNPTEQELLKKEAEYILKKIKERKTIYNISYDPIFVNMLLEEYLELLSG